MCSQNDFPKKSSSGRVIFANGILKIVLEINLFSLWNIFKKISLAAGWGMDFMPQKWNQRPVRRLLQVHRKSALHRIPENTGKHERENSLSLMYG